MGEEVERRIAREREEETDRKEKALTDSFTVGLCLFSTSLSQRVFPSLPPITKDVPLSISV